MFIKVTQTLAPITFALLVGSAFAQGYPNKPITLIVPFTPGASADGIARIIGRELSATLGQPVVVDNKPGSGGALGLMAAAKAAPDGYTISMGATGALAVNPHLPDAPPLQPEKELTPIAKVADIPLVVVAGANSGYGNLQAFLKASRSTKGGLVYGNSGQYTSQHLAGELLAAMTKIEFQAVAYRGSGPAVNDLLGGQIPVAVVDLTSAYPHVKAGKLVALGITSASRSKAAPELPTIAEEGVTGYSAPAWMGVLGPAQLPTDVRTRLSDAIKTAMAKPEVQEQLLRLAAEPDFQDGPAFGKFISSESKKWAHVISKIPAPKK